MRRAALPLLMIARMVWGQVPAAPPHYVEIKIPRGVDSARVFIRYRLDDEPGTIGGWVDAQADVSSYFVATTQNGKAAVRLRALVYAPGCALRTYDLPLSGSSVQQALFDCRAVPSRWISGMAKGLKDSRIVAKYTGQWVQDFFGWGDGIVTLIPVGEANYFPDNGRFQELVPDFSGEERAGEIQFWATDPATGKVLARLLPAVHSTAASAVPVEINFVVCGVREARAHDRFGFAIRGPEETDCAGLRSH